MLNISRPAVIRQYFGKDVVGSKNRYTYPRAASVGAVSLANDPSNFVTRPMSMDMIFIADRLHNILCANKLILNLEGINLEHKFNHMTLLTYYYSSVNDRKSSMGYHSDTYYRLKDGLFDDKRNSQVKNTVTCVLTVGDNRDLKWKRRRLGFERVRTKWIEDNDFGVTFNLCNSSVTVINPRDEDPLDITHEGKHTQYLHGGVSITGDKLSFGLVFRYVMGKASYSPTTHRMTSDNKQSKIDYSHLYEKCDPNDFITKLRTSYTDKFY